MNPSERKHARHYALQAMYQWQLSQTALADIETEFLKHQINKKIDLDYFKELLHQIPNHHAALDQRIMPHLQRSFADIDPIELAILRIGTYELTHRPDIPYRVAINEALELTKKFASVESYKFVNSVLDQIAHQIRTTEISSEGKNAK